MTNNVSPTVLHELSFIADGERGAVLGPEGNLAWLCVPRWHDEPVFAELICVRCGHTITHTDPWHVWDGSYEPASLIWNSRWVASESVIE